MKIVAVTSCPTGIAHTYMAAEALEMAAKELGYDIKVETQGSVGAENVLTDEEIDQADAVIIAASTKVGTDRFVGKKLLEVGVQEAIKDAKGLIQEALKAKPVTGIDNVDVLKAERREKRSGPYKHLLTGVSYMIPFVVAGGISIAISFLWGYKAFDPTDPSYNVWADAFMTLGGGSGAFGLIVPILAGYMAFSIADRPGLVPGMVGGMLANAIGAGFLGGIVAGFLAGYTVLGIKYLFLDVIKLPKSFQGLMPILILPLFSTVITGLIMFFVIGKPFAWLNTAMTNALASMQEGSAIVLGLVIGLMMAFDMGGPVNKAAYTFGVGLIASGVTAPMAAVMAAGMTPPLGLALATLVRKQLFTRAEREAGKAAWVLGASFITEGAIPFASADPLRVIPSIMVGSGITGALSMAFNCTLAVPHGGIFVMFIPGVVTKLGLYIVAILIGTVVTTAMIILMKTYWKKKQPKE